MIYKYQPNTVFNLKPGHTAFHFSAGNYSYISDESIIGPLPDGTEKYVPTAAEATEMVSEYRIWCAENNLTADETLIRHLTDIDTVKQILLDEVSVKAAEFELNLNPAMYFVSSMNFRCNGDRRTKDNLSDLYTYFDLQAQGGHIMYRDYDNEMRPLTKEQVLTLLTEHVQNGQDLYMQKWSLQQKIADADNMDQLHELKIDFSMKDFTK